MDWSPEQKQNELCCRASDNTIPNWCLGSVWQGHTINKNLICEIISKVGCLSEIYLQFSGNHSPAMHDQFFLMKYGNIPEC